MNELPDAIHIDVGHDLWFEPVGIDDYYLYLDITAGRLRGIIDNLDNLLAADAYPDSVPIRLRLGPLEVNALIAVPEEEEKEQSP